MIQGLKARPMIDFGAGFQPFNLRLPWSWGAAPGWYRTRLRRWFCFVRFSGRLSMPNEMSVSGSACCRTPSSPATVWIHLFDFLQRLEFCFRIHIDAAAERVAYIVAYCVISASAKDERLYL
jgi:hypothetical protein